MLGEGGVAAINGETLRMKIDKSIEDQLLITLAPSGYLIRT